MTKTIDLVTLYYKGHSPLKKQDNSYLMCLYTMLFVLFAMVIILMLCTLHQIDPIQSRVVDSYNKQQKLKEAQSTTKKTTTIRTTEEDLNSYYEETAAPFVDWNKVKDFFFGEEESTTLTGYTTNTTRNDNLSNNTAKNNSVAVKQEHNQYLNNPPATEQAHHDVDTEIEETTNMTETILFLLHNNDYKMKTETAKTELNFVEWQEVTSTPQDKDSEWITSPQNMQMPNRSSHVEVQRDCESPKCKVAASGMLSLMDFSVEPCRDFYSFACGGNGKIVKEEPQLLPLEPTFEANFLDKISQFYESCIGHQVHMNYRDRIRATKRVLSGIHISTLEQHSRDLTDVFAILVLLDAMPFFNLDIDVHNSSFVFKLLPPERTLSSKYWSPMKEMRKNCLRTVQPDNYGSTIDITFLYYHYEECQRNIDYLKSLQTAMEELGHFGNLSSEQREKYISKTISFIQKDIISIFEDIPSSLELQENIENFDSVRMNVGDLQKLVPLIDWFKLFEHIKVEQIEESSTVQVFGTEYFKILSEKLLKIERSKLVVALMAILTEKYYQELVLPTPRHSRVKFCNNLSRKLFPDISNYLYRKTTNPEVFNKQKTYIKDMFENMKQNFKTVLMNETWIDETSRNSMTKKLNRMKLDTSNDSKDTTFYLDKLYSGLHLKAQDFSFNYKQSVSFRRKKFFSLQGQLVNNKNILWNFMDQLNKEPVYFYGYNIVYIPDKIVRETFLDLPNYLIMAQIGFPLAKVIGHAFDPIGMKYDTNLSANVTSLYDKFVREMQKTLPHHINFNKMNLVFSLNSRISRVERFAENAAMALLLNSIEEIQYQALIPLVSFTFSREKIFFMALVQGFCEDVPLMEFVVQAHESAVLPAQFRVQNILHNSESFHTQFSCRPTAKSTQLQFPYLSVLLEKDIDKIT